jgi:amino acid permease
MAFIAKKFQFIQLVLVLVVMLTGFGVTWGKVTTEIIQTKIEQNEIVVELKKIREEIVRLRIETAVTNERLESHITADTNGE